MDPQTEYTMRPRYIVKHPKLNVIYVSYSRRRNSDNQHRNGRIVAYSYNAVSGQISLLNGPSVDDDHYRQPVSPDPRHFALSPDKSLLLIPSSQPTIDLDDDDNPTDKRYISMIELDIDTGEFINWDLRHKSVGTGPLRPFALHFHPTKPLVYTAMLEPEPGLIFRHLVNADFGLANQTLLAEASPHPSGQAWHLLIDKDAEFMYVPSRGSSASADGISVFFIHASGTTISPVQDIAMQGDGPVHLAWGPDETMIYSANRDSDSISTFYRNPDGTLEHLEIINDFTEESVPFYVLQGTFELPTPE